MVLEMRRALESLKNKDLQGYRKLFDASYEDVYCRSILIIRQEEQAREFVKDFFADLFGSLKDAQEDVQSQEKWFWQKYYQKMRKQYHKLLKNQSTQPVRLNKMADLMSAFPLLHRIMLVMYYGDDFAAGEISAIFGLAEDKIQSELEKMEKALPSLAEKEAKELGGYQDSWKLLVLGASRQAADSASWEWADRTYAEAAFAAGITVTSAAKKQDSFEYFVADAEPEPEKPRKKVIPIVEEEPEEELYDDEDEEDEDDRENYEDEEEDEGGGRYDWDIEDDGKRMVILGIVLAVVIVIIISFAAYKLLNKEDGKEKEPSRTEQEEDGAPLLIKGGEEDEPEEDPEENPEEAPPEGSEEEPAESQEEEPASVIMETIPNSMNVRSGPSTNDTVVTTVKAGEKLEVLDDPSQEWVHIRCVDQDNKEGYVKSEYLKAAE